MTDNEDLSQKSFASFYDKQLRDDENLLTKIKPILNQILEFRVAIKELHIQYGVQFSEMITSYQNRLQDIKGNYDTLILELKNKEEEILKMSSELLDTIPK